MRKTGHEEEEVMNYELMMIKKYSALYRKKKESGLGGWVLGNDYSYEIKIIDCFYTINFKWTGGGSNENNGWSSEKESEIIYFPNRKNYKVFGVLITGGRKERW